MSDRPAYRVDPESKPDPSGLYRVRKVKHERRLCGHVFSYVAKFREDSVNVFWNLRRTDQMSNRDNCWYVDLAAVESVGPFSVGFIGIHVEDGTKLLIKKNTLRDQALREAACIKLECREYWVTTDDGPKVRSGPMRYYIPVAAFAVVSPPQEVTDEALIKRMGIKSTRRTKPIKLPVVS